MTAETLEAAVLNAPIEVQDRLLKQLSDRFMDRHPGQIVVPINNGCAQQITHLHRPLSKPTSITDERKAILLQRMETVDDTYTLDEIMVMVAADLAKKGSE